MLKKRTKRVKVASETEEHPQVKRNYKPTRLRVKALAYQVKRGASPYLLDDLERV